MSEMEKALSFEEKLQQVQELTAMSGMSRRLTVLQNGKETEVSDENV